jgi:folate-binding protein YgfZ
MKPDWKKFLDEQGAVFDDLGVTVLNFGNATRERKIAVTGSLLCDLSHLGLIAATGTDARNFLQSQLTNDTREITPERSRLGGYCTAKGRLLAVFRIVQRGETIYLQLPYELLEATLKRLRMFVLRAKVTLEDATDTFVRLGFSGPQAEAQLAEATGRVPQAVNHVVHVNDVTIVRVPGTVPRYELSGELPQMQQLWQRLAVHAAPVGAEVWNLLDVLAGIPQVYRASSEEFVPQMVNLPAIGGVSFQKGCYPGQEIVARMQYLGTLKRRMYLGHIDADNPPAPGTSLHEAGAESTQSVGNVVNAQRAPDGGCAVLAVVVIAAAERDNIRVASADGPPLKFQHLPYSLE